MNKMENKKKFEFEFKYVKIGLISSDSYYQRKLTPTVKAIASDFDWNKFRPVVLSRRDDGSYWVMDGQHRTQGAFLALGAEEVIPAIVYYGLTRKEEAEMFAHQYDNVRQLTKGEFFKAELFAGNEDIRKFKEATEAEGIECDFSRRSKGDGYIVCYGAAFDVFTKVGEIPYRNALSVLVDAWNGEATSLSANFVRAMSLFLSTYSNEIQTKALKLKDLADALKNVSPKEIEREAKLSRVGGVTRYAKQFLRVYNKRRTTRRLEDRLS